MKSVFVVTATAFSYCFLAVAEDGSLYVADFTNFCVFRFAESDNRGHVVAGEDGKQLLDVDYLKDSCFRFACSLPGNQLICP